MTVWGVDQALGHGVLVTIRTRKSILIRHRVGDVQDGHRLKRERQTSKGSSSSDSGPIERKTVRVMSIPRPDGGALGDEPWGTTKLDFMDLADGRTVCAKRESLSENDKG